MPSKQDIITKLIVPVYHIYMIFDVTMGTDRLFHLRREFVKMTTKSVRSSKLTVFQHKTGFAQPIY